MQKYIFPIFLFLYSAQIFSQALPINSPERKQLVAMGFELQKQAVTDDGTIADNGDIKIAIGKSKDRLVLSLSFLRKKLSDRDEFRLLKIANKINTEATYQISLHEETFAAALYDYGNYDSKTFAKMIRMLEQFQSYIFENTELVKLLNE